ncbi:MAG TPA: SLC13 family permease [Nocardioides sp.]|uniref:SLC13 family permease n=1 Tax=Nocardioides sp. TaxID=35761 RepID=UPI002E375DFD|nr:SLC13 family permease [Nocardioides sp.]HEX5089832.1 SLC13 family permease [Nocardioides sp.]
MTGVHADVATALADALALAALGALLVTAILHLPWRQEAAVAVVATVVVLATGLVSRNELEDTVRALLPVVVFLVTILVVCDVCARAGLFAAAARLVGRASHSRPDRLFLGVFLLAALVTAVLSLDATVVLLTPIVVGAAATLGTSDRPGAFACLRMANSASLLLPVSNLTNLLALPHLDLTFLGFAARMAPVLLAVLVVEYAGLRLLFRGDLAAPQREHGELTGPPVPLVPVVVVALMLVGFAVLSHWDVAPAWVSSAAALVLVVWAAARRLVRPRDVVRAGHPSFALLVVALGITVAAVSTGFLGDLVARLVPDGTSFAALMALAVLATLLAALVTNLSATILLVPMVAPLGTTAVVAALLGLNIGSGLTWTGSLANLLWRRTLVRSGRRVSSTEFHRVSLVITPASLVAGVGVLALLAR